MVEWANITWIMLHTFTVKIKENIIITHNNEIKDFLYLVINNLPCSICRNKSNKYFNDNIKTIIDKETLIIFLYNFHNFVNLILNKKQFDYHLLNRYYLTKTEEIFSIFNKLNDYPDEIKDFLIHNIIWFND
jgi:hypothetical protein